MSTEPRPVDIPDPAVRRAALTERYGAPEPISASDAIALAAAAGIIVTAPVNGLWASIYRDAEAAGAWGESNLVHNGHPTLKTVPLPDGRVIGLLDLRPAQERAGRRIS